MSGRYHGSTTAGQWLDRIVAHGLGTRSRVELTLTDAGLDVVRPGATRLLRPGRRRCARPGSTRASRARSSPRAGCWSSPGQHGDRLIDSGFRSDRAAEHADWVDAINQHDQHRRKRKAHDDDLHPGSRQRLPPYSSWRTAGSSAAAPTGPWGRPSARPCSPPA